MILMVIHILLYSEVKRKMSKEYPGKSALGKLMFLVRTGLAGKQDQLSGRPDQVLTFDDQGRPSTMSIAQLLEQGGGSGSGGSSNGLTLMSEGELEDTVFETGTFNNAGEGWNTYKFREAFEAVPQVFVQPIGNEDIIVQTQSISETGFLYCVRRLNGTTITNVGTEIPIQYFALDYGGER